MLKLPVFFYEHKDNLQLELNSWIFNLNSFRLSPKMSFDVPEIYMDPKSLTLYTLFEYTDSSAKIYDLKNKFDTSHFISFHSINSIVNYFIIKAYTKNYNTK